jgi:hypothetical protein
MYTHVSSICFIFISRPGYILYSGGSGSYGSAPQEFSPIHYACEIMIKKAFGNPYFWIYVLHENTMKI